MFLLAVLLSWWASPTNETMTQPFIDWDLGYVDSPTSPINDDYR